MSRKRRRDSAGRGCQMCLEEDALISWRDATTRMIGDATCRWHGWWLDDDTRVNDATKRPGRFTLNDYHERDVADLRCDPWIEDTFRCRIRWMVLSGCVSCWSQLRGRSDVHAHELLSVSDCHHGTQYGTACGLQSRAVYEPRMACGECFSTRGTNSALLTRRLIVTFPAASATISFEQAYFSLKLGSSFF